MLELKRNITFDDADFDDNGELKASAMLSCSAFMVASVLYMGKSNLAISELYIHGLPMS